MDAEWKPKEAEPEVEKAEYTLDLNHIPKQIHRWIDRGLKISCEGAGHPHHSHFKISR